MTSAPGTGTVNVRLRARSVWIAAPGGQEPGMLTASPPTPNPGATTFVIMAFEGPDAYARAGGLAVRVTELAQALAEGGHTVHLMFVGDPALPGEDVLLDGRLVLHRWCQWISQYHPEGVYAGEDGKWRDFSDSAPPFVVDEIVRPCVARG